MTNIDLHPKVKKELDKFMEKLGVKVYSDAVNMLLFFHNNKSEGK